LFPIMALTINDTNSIPGDAIIDANSTDKNMTVTVGLTMR